ncbi:phosphoglycerate dehydrogenase [Flavobacteriaceae bacterium]|jgi:phosphoglycerate dehydrogenase-like enzyme|nr:phosphoglycerate dehydrogenase [Flavobacteriaceae bacterium]
MKVKVSTIAFSKNKYLVECLLKEFPDAEVNIAGLRLNESSLVDYFSETEAAIVGLELITPSILKQLPKLRMIAKYGVGLDNIDLKACKEKNVQIGWTGGVNKRSVSEMTLGFMLMLSRNLFTTSYKLKQMVWDKKGGTQLTGKTIGIIGLGNIGKDLVSLLQPFGCNFLVNDIIDISDYASHHNLRCVSKDEIYKNADIITIHTPLNKETSNLINLETLKMMKSTAFLINTARGGIVNEKDLIFALEQKIISGAALDVYESESVLNEDLLLLPNLICTPHTGGNSHEAVVAMGLSAIEHLIRYRNKTK